MATNTNASIQYHASGMIICIQSDASYLSITKSRSRAGGIHFLSDAKPNSTEYKTYAPLMKIIIHVVYEILRNVMSSATEAALVLSIEQ